MPGMLGMLKSAFGAMPGPVSGAIPVLVKVLEVLNLVKDILIAIKGIITAVKALKDGNAQWNGQVSTLFSYYNTSVPFY